MKPTEKYKYWPQSDIKRQARHLATKCADGANHVINKFLIFKFYSWEVVNSEKLTIECFETEDEAINYCLDKYKDSKIPEQKSLAI